LAVANLLWHGHIAYKGSTVHIQKMATLDHHSDFTRGKIVQPVNAFHGIYAATLTPFDADGEIDAPLLDAHFRQVGAVEGVAGILCNGHAGENYLLTREETRRVAEIAVGALGGRRKIVFGVASEATREARARAQEAIHVGVDALIVFPPHSWAVSNEPEMIVNHHRAICESVDVPVFLYLTSIWSGRMNYSVDVLARLVQLPNVIALKEGSWDTNVYERTRAVVRAHAPHVAVLASADMGLFPSFVLGTEGSMVSLAVIAGREIVLLYNLVKAGRFEEARALHDRLQRLAIAIYDRTPAVFAVPRLKVAMQLLGHWPHSGMREPISMLPEHEVSLLRQALYEAGLGEG
jgi:4-hydroxy-tetrahydrodipicolinate synthase